MDFEEASIRIVEDENTYYFLNNSSKELPSYLLASQHVFPFLSIQNQRKREGWGQREGKAKKSTYYFM